MYEVCKIWVLQGTHTQCMRFVNFCYMRDTEYEVSKTWMLKHCMRFVKRCC